MNLSIWKKFGFMALVVLFMAVGMVVVFPKMASADNGSMPQPYYFNPDDPGFKYLNQQAKEAAVVVGYGLQSLTPKYCTFIYRYGGTVTWYPNWMAYRAAAITPGQKDVKIGPYQLDAKTAGELDGYTIPIGN